MRRIPKPHFIALCTLSPKQIQMPINFITEPDSWFLKDHTVKACLEFKKHVSYKTFDRYWSLGKHSIFCEYL